MSNILEGSIVASESLLPFQVWPVTTPKATLCDTSCGCVLKSPRVSGDGSKDSRASRKILAVAQLKVRMLKEEQKFSRGSSY